MQFCPIQGFFSHLDITEIAKLLRSGDFSVKELVQHSLESIDKWDQQLNAFCHIDRRYALQQAEYADQLFAQGIDLGLLHGIPVAIKDNIQTLNLKTSMGSQFFKDFVPSEDADCVKKLKALGAIIIGKTNTNEFAYGPTGDCSFNGATKNPWDLTKISGGSSCGSAVAVAAGMVPIAIGTDTGGSIRIPASLTGVIGFKPSYSTLSMTGVYPLAKTLDHLGILVKTAEDIDIVLNALNNSLERKNLNFLDKMSVKLGWIPVESITDGYETSLYQKIQASIFQGFSDQIHVLENLSTDFIQIHQCFCTIQNSEAYAIHAERVKNDPSLFQPEVLQRLLRSKDTKGWEYINALQLREEYIQKFSALFQSYDFLLMPTLPIYATDLYQREITVSSRNIMVKDALLSLTSPWNLLGLPACSIPLMTDQGLPIGLQIICANNNENQLIHFISSVQSIIKKI
ncbi:amidase [Acinetobacter populi]|uniref:Amidase n=1 Tax=Acinetobacter populi TaxID=1582270 RepID=A0A1Z9YZ74_9GAMM|nr:amidase [Acinetobacter populi]OUY07504.1 amidase [Acinetobacter populi]